ncbi:hypothetical protein Y032_0042g505 [Ancylostoma ceylanicum]|uniref:Uncharacterized protein n=1 Tax=Ancylostoma ceylanicum TaxID=53326 RepID=A0A016UFW6_9BILA|nr:hypothetical protein Y032_0042g505 [Ancylostoma ceylanicum]
MYPVTILLKAANAKGGNSVFWLGSIGREEQPFLYWIFGDKRKRGSQTWKIDFRICRYFGGFSWFPLGTKLSVSHPRKEVESDDDDMVVFEKIAGAFKGDRPKINDMGRTSIS